MKRLYTLLVLALFSTCITAQTTIFAKKYKVWNEMSINNFQQTSDGGYILSTDAIPEMDTATHLGKGYLIKMNSQGTTTWLKSYPKTNAFIKEYDGCSVYQTNDGGYIIGCDYYISTSNSTNDESFICLIKTDASGNLQWTQNYPGKGTSNCWCVKQTSDLGYIVCGGTTDTIANVSYAYLLKTDNSGNPQWGKAYSELSSGNGGQANCVNQTSDGGYILCGTGFLNGGFIIKTDNVGTISWFQSYGSINYDQLYGIRQTSNGGYIAVGNTYDTTSLYNNSVLLRLDNAGNFTWRKKYFTNTGSGDVGYSVRETNSGGFAFTYQHNSSSGMVVNGLMKTDASGNVLWAKIYNDLYAGVPSYLEKTTDNGFAFPTYYYDMTSLFQVTALMKTDSSGNAPCHDSLKTVTVTPFAPVVCTGFNAISIDPVMPYSTVFTETVVKDSSLCNSPESVLAFEAENSFSVFPNPSNGNFNVHLDQLSGENVEFKIYDMMGKIILQKKEENIFGVLDENFDLKNFSGGIYFVAVKVENGNAFVKKIVKSE